VTLVAVGDSMVHAEESWPEWLAKAMGQPLRRISANGARADDVLVQLSSLAGERYAVACLSVGGNDALFDWDATVFAERIGEIATALLASADRVVIPTISRSLAGFPGGGGEIRRRVVEANAVLAASGLTVFPGDDLHGPRLHQADRIHPTLEGQLFLADRAAEALGVIPAPSSLAEVPPRSGRWAYHRVAAGQAPRRAVKRALGRPMYRDPRAG
jgi:hypothetical protein